MNKPARTSECIDRQSGQYTVN